MQVAPKGFLERVLHGFQYRTLMAFKKLQGMLLQGFFEGVL